MIHMNSIFFSFDSKYITSVKKPNRYRHGTLASLSTKSTETRKAQTMGQYVDGHGPVQSAGESVSG